MIRNWQLLVLFSILFGVTSPFTPSVTAQGSSLIQETGVIKVPSMIQESGVILESDVIRESRLKLVFTGDIMGHDTQIASALATGEPGYDYTPCFQFVEPYLKDADLFAYDVIS